jgi:hypothetical protein
MANETLQPGDIADEDFTPDSSQSAGPDATDLDPQSAMAAQGLRQIGNSAMSSLQSQYQQGGEQIHQALQGDPGSNPQARQALEGLGQQAAMSTVGSIYKVPLENGLETKVFKNPTPTQARNLYNKTKSQSVRYFGDPDGNLHMWDAHDLTHSDVMEHNGIPDTSDNYAGAGQVNSASDAENIAERFKNDQEDKLAGNSYAQGGNVNRPPSYNAMQYYDDGGDVTQPGDIPDAQFVPDPVQTPTSQGLPPQSDQDQIAQPGDIPDSEFTPDSTKYGTPSQLAIATLEQGAQGFAGPLAPLAETKLGLTTPEAMRARQTQLEEQEPGVGATTKFAGALAGLATGVGELGLLAKGSEALASAAGLTKASTLVSKVGAGALRGATEMGLLAAGDEATRQIIEDPTTSSTQTLYNIGLSSLLGAGLGGTFGGAGYLLSRGNAAKVVQEAENLKGRMQQRFDVPDQAAASHDQLSARYNEVSDIQDSLFGDKGLKSQVIAKTVPPTMTDGILGQSNDTLDLMNSTLEDMKAKPSLYPPNLVSKLENDITNYKASVFPEAPEAPVSASDAYINATNRAAGMASDTGIMQPQASSGPSPFNVFSATQDLKQMAGGYAKLGQYVKVTDPSYDFVQKMKPIAQSLKSALEDENVWGDAAKFQNTINKSWSNFKPTYDAVTKQFTENVPSTDPITGRVTIEPRISLNKMETYIKQLGTARTSAKDTILSKFLDHSEDLAQSTRNAYDTIGEETPYTASPVNVLRENLKQFTPGMKLADVIVDKGFKGVAHGTAGAMGSALGGGLGSLFGPGGAIAGASAGAIVGERALGPLFEKALPILGKSFFEGVANYRGLTSAADHIYNYAKGGDLIRKGAQNVFKAGAEVLPVSVIPTITKIGRLNKQLVAIQNNPQQFTQAITNNPLGTYLPGHAQALTQTLGNASNYLNGLRPDTAPKAPLDSERKPSNVQQGAYNSALAIAQQPLTVMKKVKDGTITPDDLKHVTSLYPAAYDQMKKQLSDAMADHISKGNSVPYKTRVGLSIFMQQPMDSTFTPQAIQSAQPQPAPPPPQPASKGGSNKRSTKDLHKISDQTLTPGQARQKGESEKGE